MVGGDAYPGRGGSVVHGDLFRTTGTDLGIVPFNPGDFAAIKVGAASFRPSAPDKAVLAYNVGAVAVAKNIQRQTLTPIPLAGTHSGGLAVNDSGCLSPGDNGPVSLPAPVTVTQPAAGPLQMSFDFLGVGTCTLVSTGAIVQSGALHAFPASLTCMTDPPYARSVSELKATSLGIEGRWTGPAATGGCHEEARFSALVAP